MYCPNCGHKVLHEEEDKDLEWGRIDRQVRESMRPFVIPLAIIVLIVIITKLIFF